MNKPKPKSGVAGVYFRDDGLPRWEVKIRWVEKDGKKGRLETERFPVDPKAQKKEAGHIDRARVDAEAYALGEWQHLQTFGKPKSLRADAWTLRALLERYLDDLDKGLIPLKSPKTVRSTIRMLLGQGKGHNKDGFPDIVKRWVAELRYEHFVGKDAGCLQMQLKDRDGNKVGNSSLKRVLTVVRGVFKRAQETWKIQLNNPLEKITGLPDDDARERTIDEDEWTKITAELAQHHQGTQDAITFARYTAARRSEVIKLDWGDINFKKKLAHLRDTKSKKDKNEGRVIPLPAQAWDIIIRRAQPADAKKVLSAEELSGLKLGGPIFTNEKGARLRPDSITQAWSRACGRAGVVGARVHDLRHTRITEMGRFLTAAEAARVSGHTDLATFFRYFNPDPVETGRKIDAMEGGNTTAAGLRDVAKALAALNSEDFGTAITMAIQIQARSAAGR